MKTFVTIVKAIITRALFATHAFIAVWKLVDLKGQLAYWYMVAPLLLQGFEAIVSICARNGEEMKWFCPSVFLYLVSVVPPIWLMELGLNDLRVNSTHDITSTGNSNFLEIAGLKLDLASPIEQWVRVLEQVLLVMLLVGRWLLPKGMLTREQLSQLLLAYMAMAADIIELFECFKEDTVTENVELIYATLGIWSWSLLQFTLVLSATHAPKLRPTINYPPPRDVTPEDNNLCDSEGVAGRATCAHSIHQYLDMDIIAILTTVFMQDGPFFLLRMTLIFGYNVISYLNIFFTCKNTLVLSLQLYRLFVLCSRKRNLNMKKKELHSDESSPSEVSVESEDSSHPEPSQMVQDKLPPPPPVLPPTPPPPTTATTTNSTTTNLLPIDDLSINQTLEESLLEIIEQIGEENILRELENLVSLPEEQQEMAMGNSSTSLGEVNEQTVSQVWRREPVMCPQRECEERQEEDYSPPDSGFQNCNNTPSSCRKTLKRQHSVSKRNQDYLRRIQNSCYGSDYASYSDNDMVNDHIHSVDLSSSSLVDSYTEGRLRGWNVIRERYLPSSSQQEGEWRGASVPSSLHREPSRRGVRHSVVPLLPHQDSDSPQPHRRERHGSSLKGRPGSSSRVPQRSWSGSSLPRHHSVATSDHFPSKYDCISESDADTLETNV